MLSNAEHTAMSLGGDGMGGGDDNNFYRRPRSVSRFSSRSSDSGQATESVGSIGSSMATSSLDLKDGRLVLDTSDPFLRSRGGIGETSSQHYRWREMPLSSSIVGSFSPFHREVRERSAKMDDDFLSSPTGN